eukprot:TRINITY_DN8669_c0_g1_i2.p1 TRINITY_DN8669_c0_g1~~TRINITY_DN8669_c0_g1_i2.p1  ORF type:complete len:491 (+),score=68.86 TRINITY_DN8669_c0_g1_i2:123-1595(+)
MNKAVSAAIRGIWCFSMSDNKPVSVVYDKRYATVNARAKVHLKDDYFEAPNATDMLELVRDELASKDLLRTSAFEGEAALHVQDPVHALGLIWPVLIVEQDGFCVAMLLLTAYRQPELKWDVNSPVVAAAIQLSNTLLEVTYALRRQPSAVQRSELHTYLAVTCPFGQWNGMPYAQVGTMLAVAKAGAGAELTQQSQLPAWRFNTHKGKPQVDVQVREEVHAMQFGSPDNADIVHVSGAVLMKASIADLSDLTCQLSSIVPLSQIAYHFCVRDHKCLEPEQRYQMSLLPPDDRFELATYTIRNTGLQLPVRGIFQMAEKTDDTITLLMQLKLSASIPNAAMEFCQVKIPFFDRGEIKSARPQAQGGSVIISESKHELVWNVGKAFTSRDQELSLEATIEFDLSKPSRTESVFGCSRLNSYAKAYFSIQQRVLSDVAVDLASIKFDPPQKSKVKTSQVVELSSGDYYIWNLLGQAPQGARSLNQVLEGVAP